MIALVVSGLNGPNVWIPTVAQLESWRLFLALFAMAVLFLFVVFALAHVAIDLGSYSWREWRTWRTRRQVPRLASDAERREQLDAIVGAPATWQPRAAKGFHKTSGYSMNGGRR